MTGTSDGGGAIFVLPTTTVGQLGAGGGVDQHERMGGGRVARQLGQAWIVTRHGVLTIDEVRRRAATGDQAVAATGERRVRRLVPPLAKTGVKDAREAQRARGFHVDPKGPWTDVGAEVAFVWQRHELFHRAGIDLATALAAPSVLFVPALIVWQAERWSVARPGWGRWLERHAEVPALQAATLVACGTDVIAEQVARLGVPEDHLLVTPTGVDLELFGSPVDRAAVRASLGLGDGFVIGWAGSFRPFHQIEQLVHAAVDVPDATLLFVGDGPERAAVEQLATELGVPARFSGLVPHAELPQMLAAMDVGVVLARPDAPFHYSPLKVAEYLAAGLPVVAPEVPQLTDRLQRDDNAAFYPAGDVGALAAVLRALRDDAERRGRLAEGARSSADAWSWDHQVRRVRDALAR